MLPRRAGKDIVALNLAIRQLLRRVCTIFYIFPTYSQARKALWDAIDIQGKKILDYIPERFIASKNSSELKVTLNNGSVLQFIGSDNYDRLRGTNPFGVIFSEYSTQNPAAYATVRPILAANGGWVIFVSTPFGKNHFWDLYQIALNSKDWFCYHLTLDDTNHIPMEEINSLRLSGEMSEAMISQEFFCFPGDQQVLTADGLTDISDIKLNELVFSHSGRLRKVTKLFKREYSGSLISIRSYGSYETIRSTPEHPIRVYCQETQEYSWKKAGEITIKDRIVFPKKQLSNVSVISYELCMLLAWYISDGSCFKNGVQFTVNEEKTKRIKELLNALDIKFTVLFRDKEHVNNVIIASVFYVDFFRDHCGVICYEKHIPFSLIIGFEKDFFHELMKGDGCHSIHKGHEKYSFSTTSKSLAYQVQFLANSLNLGYAAGITHRKGGPITFPHGKTYETRESYSVQIFISKLKNHFNYLSRAKYGIAAKIMSIETEDYTGGVYNLAVQYDESYIVGGRAVHNCSFETGVEGSYYGKIINEMRLNNRIGDVSYESSFPVHTAWDVGYTDATAIIFFQVIGKAIHIIDYYENNNMAMEAYVGVVKNKPYAQNYGKHIAPHDISNKNSSNGLSPMQIASQLGLNFVRGPRMEVFHGIQAVRAKLPTFWVDERKCSKLIKMLENYRKVYNQKKMDFEQKPLHDYASHASDSMRLLCTSLNLVTQGTSAEELNARYNRVMYGSSGGNSFNPLG